MSYTIEIYRGNERKLFMEMSFLDTVRISLARLLGRDMSQAKLQVVMLSVPEEVYARTVPVVENGVPDYGYSYVKVFIDDALVYQHPHPLRDIVGDTLQLALREKFPNETVWTYRINVPGIPALSAYRPAPPVEGSVLVTPYAPGEKAGFAIRRIEEDAPPARSLEEFGLEPRDRNRRGDVTVLVHEDVRHDLLHARALSSEVEEGGFLVGRVYMDSDCDGSYLLEVTGALQAEFTGASLLHFTFTGDSFAEVKRTLSRHREGDRLLGWYHTHLFAATADFGLSSVDLVLHANTFTIPWQVAGLVNIGPAERVLRFYYRKDGTMIECAWLTINERNGNSIESHKVGDRV